MIAAQHVAKAAADGYTVMITTNTTHAANEHLYKKLPYDPVKDFAPVTGLGKGGLVLVVNVNSPYKSLTGLLAAARANPGKPADVPCVEVKSVGEALEQPIVQERQFIKTVDHPTAGPLRVLGNPVRFENRFESSRNQMPPGQGEHTAEVLRAAGLSDAEIENLGRIGAVKLG